MTITSADQVHAPTGTLTVALTCEEEDSFATSQWAEQIQAYERKGWAVRQVVVLNDSAHDAQAMAVLEYPVDGGVRVTDMLEAINETLTTLTQGLKDIDKAISIHP